MVNRLTIAVIGLVFSFCVPLAGCGSRSGYASNIMPLPGNSTANTAGGSIVAGSQSDNESTTVIDPSTAVDVDSTPNSMTAFAPAPGLYPSPTSTTNPSAAIPMALPAPAPTPTMTEQEEIVDGKIFPVSDIDTDGHATVEHGSTCDNVALDLVVAQLDHSKVAAKTRRISAHNHGSRRFSIIGNCGLLAAHVKVLTTRDQLRFDDVGDA